MPSRRVLRAWSAVLLIVGVGAFLMGPSSPKQISVLIAVFVVAISLGGFSILPMTNRGAEAAAPRLAGHRARARLSFAVAGGVLAAIALFVGFFVAEGEAQGHVFFHLGFALVALLLFIAVGMMWRSSPVSESLLGRQILLTVLWLAAGALLLESIGAGGYDVRNETTRIGWLTALHGIAAPIAGVGLLVIPFGAITLAILLLRALWTRWRSPKRTA